MRKSKFVLLLSAVLLLGYSKIAWADTDAESAPVSITVNGLFGLELTNTNGLLFGPNAPGTYAHQVNLSINNNHGNAWTVSVNADPLDRTGGGGTITGANFKYKLVGSGSGTANPGFDVEANMPASPTVIYTAGSSEHSVFGMALGLYVIVTIPNNQAQGAYTTTLNVTLTDAV